MIHECKKIIYIRTHVINQTCIRTCNESDIHLTYNINDCEVYTPTKHFVDLSVEKWQNQLFIIDITVWVYLQ